MIGHIRSQRTIKLQIFTCWPYFAPTLCLLHCLSISQIIYLLRPRLVQRIFTEKVKETETEERNERRSFGTEETTTPFLWNTVARCWFHRKERIHFDSLFSLPSRMPEATCGNNRGNLRQLRVISIHICLTCYNFYVINSCVPNNLNFLFVCFEIP